VTVSAPGRRTDDRASDPVRALVTRLDFWIGVITVEVALVAAYFWVTPSGITGPLDIRLVLYPLLWINAAFYAVGRMRVPSAPRTRNLLAGAAACCYLLLISWLGGLFALEGAAVSGLADVGLWRGSPGWGPLVSIETAAVSFQLRPFRVIGYPALAFLLYARLLDTGGAILRSAVGLVSCVSCSLPLFAAIAGGGLGLGAGVGTTLTTYALDLSTAAYLLAVGLLLWQPGVLRQRLRSGGRTG